MAGTLVVGLLNNQQIPTTAGTLLNDKTGGLCKAWVNFNGTGTVAIRESFNVSSITDNGTGDYTVNFSNAMTDENYSILGLSSRTLISNTVGDMGIYGAMPTINNARVQTTQGTGSPSDSLVVCVSIFR